MTPFLDRCLGKVVENKVVAEGEEEVEAEDIGAEEEMREDKRAVVKKPPDKVTRKA